MSFIVKGIDLEEITRGNGYARLIIEEDGTVVDDISDIIIGEAIQIPKGHGRLIDGDELNKSVHEWNPAYAYGRSAFTREIRKAPTILEAEE